MHALRINVTLMSLATGVSTCDVDVVDVHTPDAHQVATDSQFYGYGMCMSMCLLMMLPVKNSVDMKHMLVML